MYDADKTERNRKFFFPRKGTFHQIVLGHEDCSFDKPNEKFSTKILIVLAQCPKMQYAKTGYLTFSEDVFSIKIFLWASRKQCQLARRKFLWKGQNVVAQSTTLTKQLKIFSFLPTKYSFGHVKKQSRLPHQIFHDERLKNICQVSANHKKNIRFFGELFSSEWSSGQIDWSFDTAAGKKVWHKAKIFGPKSQIDFKTCLFFQKTLFSQ